MEILLGDPKAAIRSLSGPLVVSMLITSIYNLVDGIWVAGLGADALAGVGFVIPLFLVLIGLGNGLGGGATSAISRYIGEGDKAKADNGEEPHQLFPVISVKATKPKRIMAQSIQ